jgi:hypothetical protein
LVPIRLLAIDRRGAMFCRGRLQREKKVLPTVNAALVIV